MVIWVPMLSGQITLPTTLDPVFWHAHEFLFGYSMAVVAGFLLTAVPNWTGRLPIVGWPLGGLCLLWVGGRVAVALSASISPALVAMIDLAMPAALGAAIGREIIAGKNWRNLMVLGMPGIILSLNNRRSAGSGWQMQPEPQPAQFQSGSRLPAHRAVQGL